MSSKSVESGPEIGHIRGQFPGGPHGGALRNGGLFGNRALAQTLRRKVACNDDCNCADCGSNTSPGSAMRTPAIISNKVFRAADVPGRAKVASSTARPQDASEMRLQRIPSSDAGADGSPNEKVRFGEIELYTDQASQRRHVERLASASGVAEPRRFLERANAELQRNRPIAGVPDNQSEFERFRSTCNGYGVVVSGFEADVDKFRKDFDSTAREIMNGLLDESKVRTEAEAIKVGLTTEHVTRISTTREGRSLREEAVHHTQPNSGEMGLIAEAAKLLLARRNEIDELHSKLIAANTRWASGMGPAGGGPIPPKPAEIDVFDEQMREKEFNYDVLANELAAKHPSLASAARDKSDHGALKSLAAGNTGAAAQIVGTQITEALTNIAIVKERLAGGGVTVLKVPKVVALAKAKLAAETWKSKAVDDEIAQVQAKEAITEIAIGVLNLALLAMAPATGGASLLVAAGISTVSTVTRANEFMLEAAMAGSDVDKARAISQDDPSLFWLAADVVFALVDVGQAVGAATKLLGAFGRLSPLVKAVKSAETAEEAGKALRVLEAESVAIGGEKLSQRVVASTKGQGLAGSVAKDIEKVEAVANVAERELKLAGKAATKSGQVHVTKTGSIFSCNSPCTQIREKYAETLARNRSTFLRELEQLEEKARKLGTNATQAELDGIAKEAASLDNAISASERAFQETAALKSPTRFVEVSNPQLVAEYERMANEKLPAIVSEVIDAERTTAGRSRLAQLRQDFDALRSQVGNTVELTASQTERANSILNEARELARKDFGNLQSKVTKRLRADPELLAIEERLKAVGDIEENATGGVRLRTRRADGSVTFEPVNIEHRGRLSDNPWTAKDPKNLLVTDAVQNQQYLETLRKHGAVWPTNETEDFIIRHRLNSQGIDFRPGQDGL